MRRTNKVVWQEGMFLRQHHFQQFDNYIENRIHFKQRNTNNNSWGFSELKLDFDLLALNKISIQHAAGIFQDGTAFETSKNAIIISPLELKPEMLGVTIYLCIPLALSDIADYGDNNSKKAYRFSVETTEVCDLVADSDTSEEINLAYLNCRIMTDLDDRSSYSSLAVTRVKDIASNKQYILDDNFIPPCLNIYTSPYLTAFPKQVLERLNDLSSKLSAQLSGSKDLDSNNLLLLQLLKRHSSIFYSISHKRLVHPETLYDSTSVLLSELSAHSPRLTNLDEIPIYFHDDSSVIFPSLIKQLNEILPTVLQNNLITISLVPQENGIWLSNNVEQDTFANANVVLGVYSECDDDDIYNKFHLHTKVSPISSINNIVSRSLEAISIKPAKITPRQIPYNEAYCYFTICQEHHLWSEIVKTSNIAIHISKAHPGLDLKLWVVKDGK